MKKIILAALLFLVCVSVAYAVQYESPQIKVTLLNQEPSPARAGDTVDVRFRVENTGGGIVENLQLEILQEYPFTVVNGPAVQNLGNLYDYQTNKNYINTVLTLKIDKDAVNGQHEIKIRYKYSNSDWTQSSFNVDITSKQFAQIIYVDKSKLEPGKETDMKFTITNTGNAPLQNLVFSWSEPNGVVLPVYSDDTKYIKYLDIGKSVDLVYKVIADVNAKPGLYHLDLILNYESKTNSTASSIKTKAGIFVGGETDFDVAFSQSSQGQTSLSVANTGNNPAQSVSVRVPEQPNFRIMGSNSAIIGNLDKGDYTVVSFQIVQSVAGNFTGANRQRQASQNPQRTANFQNNITVLGGNNNLKVVIDYTDTTGERRSVEKNVPIQFRPDTTSSTSANSRNSGQTSFFSSWTFYAAIAAVLLAGAYYRKKLAAFFSQLNKK